MIGSLNKNEINEALGLMNNIKNDCKYCQNEKTIISKKYGTHSWVCECDNTLEVGVKVARGKYLQIGDVEDWQCLDHGEHIKINFCPMCGRRLNAIDDNK